MPKWRLEPYQTIRVHLYILSENCAIIPDKCSWYPGQKPFCNSKTSKCNRTYETCDNKDDCTDLLGKFLSNPKYNKNRLPEGIEVIWADFQVKSMWVEDLIDNQVWDIDPVTQELRKDTAKAKELKLKYYLKDWSLEDYDESDTKKEENLIEVKTQPRMNGRGPRDTVLTTEFLQMLQHEFYHWKIINAFLDKFEEHNRKDLDRVEQEAIEALKDPNVGVPAKN